VLRKGEAMKKVRSALIVIFLLTAAIFLGDLFIQRGDLPLPELVFGVIFLLSGLGLFVFYWRKDTPSL
jgi:protein-S-isoprenylcysteine O-methyltransferase Ste14